MKSFSQFIQESYLYGNFNDTLDEYRYGSCWALAVAIHRQTKWPLAWLIAEGEHLPFHGVVVAPDGKLVDADGYTSLDKIKRTFRRNKQNIKIERVTEAQIQHICEYSDDEIEEAATFARDLKKPPFPLSIQEAVNKEGFSPNLVVYHGTSRNFDIFSNSDAQRHDITPKREIQGHFFTSDMAAAHQYAMRSSRITGGKPRVIAAHLDLKNPYNATRDIKKYQKTGMSFSDAKNKIYTSVDRNKYDGVYHDGNGANSPEYVAFKGENVKMIAK